MCPFAIGIMPDGPQRLIPEEEWEQEFKAMIAEDLTWDGERVKSRIFVELPFWLMMSDGSFSITFQQTTTQAVIHSDYIELGVNACFLDSRVNLGYLGSGYEANTDPVAKKLQRPVVRPQKTVVDFEVNVLKEAFDASEDSRVRRVNRADQYFRSLAIAHIPILNRLITSYRATSRDPFAFEVSEWDVPLWWTKYEGKLIRTSLMPYKDSDDFPAVRSFETGERSKYFAVDADTVQQQLRNAVAPGEMELLDAKSLMWRGRYSDAVRAVVTAIEVALEHQLRIIYRTRGCSEEECDKRLSEKKSTFYDRLSDFEISSGRRLPGPRVATLPHLNGLRLRTELDRARTLRHKIVHDGFRIDYFSKGLAHRAVDTMTWL